jgi:HD-GYP domain-containing protein (c-di-GMP phosphodiesterase class II)
VSHEVAVEELRRNAGAQSDRAVVDAFCAAVTGPLAVVDSSPLPEHE